MSNHKAGKNARPVGPYSRAVGRAVSAMLAEAGLKTVDMMRDGPFTSNIYAMLKGESIITVDDLKSMADFLGVHPQEIVSRAANLLAAPADELATRRRPRRIPGVANVAARRDKKPGE